MNAWVRKAVSGEMLILLSGLALLLALLGLGSFAAFAVIRRRKNLPFDSAAAELTAQPTVGEAEPPHMEPDSSPLEEEESEAPTGSVRGESLRTPKAASNSLLRRLRWVLYLSFVFGAIVALPGVLGWALDSPNPIAAVSGSSMWPTLSKGDLVFLQGVDGIEDLEVGDVIAFRQERGFSIHRVASIEGQSITTRGDGNFVNDPPITIDDVIGKVPTVGGRLARIPLLGNLSLVLGPLIGRSDDFRPEGALPQPIDDLSGRATGRTLAPTQDLAGAGQAEEGQGAPGQGAPVPDLRVAEDLPAPGYTTGRPIEDLNAALAAE